jgi:hypothetical protein
MFFGDFRTASVAALLVWIGSAMPSVASAEVFLAGPSDDIEARINALQSGDELLLSGGVCSLSERFSFAIAGTENAPITIRAADGEVHDTGDVAIRSNDSGVTCESLRIPGNPIQYVLRGLLGARHRFVERRCRAADGMADLRVARASARRRYFFFAALRSATSA